MIDNKQEVVSGSNKPLIVRSIDNEEWVSKLAYDDLKKEFDDLRREETILRRNGSLSEEEKEEMVKIRREHGELNVEAGRMATFLQTHYKREIDLGQHGAFKSLADAVMFYLGRERMMTQEGK